MLSHTPVQYWYHWPHDHLVHATLFLWHRTKLASRLELISLCMQETAPKVPHQTLHYKEIHLYHHHYKRYTHCIIQSTVSSEKCVPLVNSWICKTDHVAVDSVLKVPLAKSGYKDLHRITESIWHWKCVGKAANNFRWQSQKDTLGK